MPFKNVYAKKQTKIVWLKIMPLPGKFPGDANELFLALYMRFWLPFTF